MSRNNRKFRTDKFDSETNGSFDSCESCYCLCKHDTNAVADPGFGQGRGQPAKEGPPGPGGPSSCDGPPRDSRAIEGHLRLQTLRGPTMSSEGPFGLLRGPLQTLRGAPYELRARAEFPIQLVGRVPHQLLGLSHQLCALPHQLLPDFIVFWLPNEHFPSQARKAIGFEDLMALKILFASLSEDNHQLTWHFVPPTSYGKLHPWLRQSLRRSVNPFRGHQNTWSLQTIPSGTLRVPSGAERAPSMLKGGAMAPWPPLDPPLHKHDTNMAQVHKHDTSMTQPFTCKSCKQLRTSRLHDLHELPSFVSLIEFLRSKLSIFSARVSWVIVDRVLCSEIPGNIREDRSVLFFNIQTRRQQQLTILETGWRFQDWDSPTQRTQFYPVVVWCNDTFSGPLVSCVVAVHLDINITHNGV